MLLARRAFSQERRVQLRGWVGWGGRGRKSAGYVVCYLAWTRGITHFATFEPPTHGLLTGCVCIGCRASELH